MYNIIDQSNQVNMLLLLNGNSSSSTNGIKIDCSKECPCGVPAIPVPDQWLEVMVTGGFKVWHIIFILIAVVVTIIVVYCCFHRCRIPRTKQEIEADLMRTNLASKFRDYLQEFPNEPTTFMDALKKVQELEEKSSEQDDLGARKRKGWLKLKGKDKQERQDEADKEPNKNGPEKEPKAVVAETQADQKHEASVNDGVATIYADKTIDEKNKTDIMDPVIEPLVAALKPLDFRSMKKVSEKSETKLDKKLDAGEPRVQPSKPVAAIKEKRVKSKESKLIKTKGEKILDQGDPPEVNMNQIEADKKTMSIKTATSETAATNSTTSKPARVRKRKDKPNLARSKATHVGSRGDSIEKSNQLNLPPAIHQQHHHHSHDPEKPRPSNSSPSEHVDKDKQFSVISERKHTKSAKAKPSTGGTRAKASEDSTVIQIGTAHKLDP